MFVADEVTAEVLGTPVYISYKLIDKTTKIMKSTGYYSTYIPPLRNMKQFVQWEKDTALTLLRSHNNKNLDCIICGIQDMSDWFINKHENLPRNEGFRLMEK